MTKIGYNFIHIKPLYVIYGLWLLNQHLENCWICPWNLTHDIEGLNERLQIQLRGFWHISLPNIFPKYLKGPKSLY